MKDIILDTCLDGLKLLPFLFIAFFIIELLEHRFKNLSKSIVEKSGKFGPVIGGLLGCIPQCGFSVIATNLYITRVITMGTLISIYLSTSDEMLPILISHGSSFQDIASILLIKLIIGVVAGMIIDLFVKKNNHANFHELCEQEHCHCEKGIFISSLNHTIQILLFIMGVSFILNIVMYYGGEVYLKGIFKESSLLSFLIVGLIGLIPNCGSSVIISELYLNGVLTLPCAISGLLVGSGVSLLVLIKSNKNISENLKIIGLVYFIGVLSGLILELFKVHI